MYDKISYKNDDYTECPIYHMIKPETYFLKIGSILQGF